MLLDNLNRLRAIEKTLITGGGEWHELCPPGMTRSTLYRDMQLLQDMGLQISSTNPEGGIRERSLFTADKKTAVFRH